MASESQYPIKLDAFFTALDGHHPVVGDDFDVLMQAIEHVQAAAGSGPQAGVASTYGPKGSAASVAARLNNLFASDGSGIDDFVFITGTLPAYMFAETSTIGPSIGVSIPFGRDLSGTDQVILFGSAMPGEESDGTQTQNVLGAWVVSNVLSVNSVRLCARLANGAAIATDNDTMISWGLLVFGPKAWY